MNELHDDRLRRALDALLALQWSGDRAHMDLLHELCQAVSAVVDRPQQPRPAHSCDEPVKIGTVHRGAYFDWSQAGCGFGQLSFSTDEDGRLTCDSECMGREWVRAALHALADHVADTAHFADFPECSGDENGDLSRDA